MQKFLVWSTFIGRREQSQRKWAINMKNGPIGEPNENSRMVILNYRWTNPLSLQLTLKKGASQNIAIFPQLFYAKVYSTTVVPSNFSCKQSFNRKHFSSLLFKVYI